MENKATAGFAVGRRRLLSVGVAATCHVLQRLQLQLLLLPHELWKAAEMRRHFRQTYTHTHSHWLHTHTHVVAHTLWQGQVLPCSIAATLTPFEPRFPQCATGAVRQGGRQAGRAPSHCQCHASLLLLHHALCCSIVSPSPSLVFPLGSPGSLA